MNWIFILACLLLLTFSLDPIQITSPHHLLVWKISNGVQLIRVNPYNTNVLVHEEKFYAYLNDSNEIYVPAIRLDTNRKQYMMSRHHLPIQSYPTVVPYDSKFTNLIEILNSRLSPI
ncbi:cell envelope biogenesis protein [Lasius niger]|uniref:Cell envelope biogenesis protein n=1 Tax=Lasius niger TaxID=67767 RepID=A0A0J7JZL6_LASNI|nr:cell envelope biogenesis protein [Lasius niger]